MLDQELIEAVLTKLGFGEAPPTTLAALNALYAAFSSHVPNDNIQKRIWFAGDQTRPVTGGDPVEFFENWLTHGTGGTCFPNNGANCELLRGVGFDARRIAGSILRYATGGNHGSVIVNLEGIDYLVDAQFAAFDVLPLTLGEASSTGERIHDLHAEPRENGFDIRFYPGPDRETPLVFRTEPDHDPVNHHFFLEKYDMSALRELQRSPFNDALFISIHRPESILILGRGNKIRINADDTVVKTEVKSQDRIRVLVDEFNISEAAATALPPDEKGGASLV